MAKTLFETQDIRNIALLGHGACGKTALGEAMLYVTGATTRLGSTTNGTSTFDFEPEEVKRGGSNATAFAWTEFQGKKLNIIDTPGDGNFVYDSLVAIRGADAALVVVSAPDGVEVQTERVFIEAQQLGIPRIVVINKMDRERANPDAVIKDFDEVLGVRVVPIELPIGVADTFTGVISLLQRKAYRYALDTTGKHKVEELSAAQAEEVARAMEQLTEAVAETDDELLEKYLETMELSEEEVRTGLVAAIKSGKLVPAVYASATANIGLHPLLELVANFCPNPLERAPVTVLDGGAEVELGLKSDAPFAALVIRSFIDKDTGKLTVVRVFSGTGPGDGVVVNARTGETERLGTVYSLRGTARDAVERAVCGDILAIAKLKETRTNDTLVATDSKLSFPPMVYPPPMMEYTLQVKAKGDEDKLKSAVDKLMDEDPTLSVGYDELGRQLVLRGMGQQHLDMAVEKMKRKFKVEVSTALPLVPYRETLKKRVGNVEGKHKKQTGGAGQFGVCYLNIEPLGRGEGFQFADKIVGGAIPRQFIPSVEKGVLARMNSGPLAGYPVTDIMVELIDGKYHPVDSKDVAYQAAGSKGIRAGLEQGGCKLLEPVYKMDIIIPSDAMGSIMGDITSRRGRVLGMEPQGKKTIIHAICPLAEIQRYAPDLRSMTGGQGVFTMEFDGYEDVPGNLEAKIIKESPFRGAVEEED
ncbi:MAG: elongation factor G [Myxococcota bacterium]|jgi:elongation factor G|nr:elongation factor G [Myxococcota bacterium]